MSVNLQPLTDALTKIKKAVNITPIEWCSANRQWRRIDNIAHAKFQLNRVGSNKTFWKSVLDILGA